MQRKMQQGFHTGRLIACLPICIIPSHHKHIQVLISSGFHFAPPFTRLIAPSRTLRTAINIKMTLFSSVASTSSSSEVPHHHSTTVPAHPSSIPHRESCSSHVTSTDVSQFNARGSQQSEYRFLILFGIELVGKWDVMFCRANA